MSMPTFHLAPDLAVSRLCFGQPAPQTTLLLSLSRGFLLTQRPCVEGTMTMGEQSRLPESLRLLDAAFDAGVNFFDSAEMYYYAPLLILPPPPHPHLFLFSKKHPWINYRRGFYAKCLPGTRSHSAVRRTGAARSSSAAGCGPAGPHVTASCSPLRSTVVKASSTLHSFTGSLTEVD